VTVAAGWRCAGYHPAVPPKIVVGLGNPGSRYADTRHNVGWMVLDRLSDRGGMSGHQKARDGAAVTRGRLDGLDLVLVKPTTYMNLSGIAVRKVLARDRVPMSDLLVVVDDIALPLGRLRLREEGSAGGHNGLRSIIGEMGTQRFARLRVGIGEPARGAVDHVLSRFDASERGVLDEALDAAADAVMDWAREGPTRAANRWNAWRPAHAPTGETVGDGRESVGDGRDGGARQGALAPLHPGGEAEVSGEGRQGPGTPPLADERGIVRTRTGWRRLLPGGGRQEGRGDPRSRGRDQ
jgi:peptidyl-tRNA hydrolase, PTH1 family